MYQEEKEDEEEKYRGNKFKRVTPLTLEYMCTKWATDQMFYISERKHRKREPEPTASSSGQMYTRKNPDLKSPIPLVIQPTLEGTYQLPACCYPLDLSRF